MALPKREEIRDAILWPEKSQRERILAVSDGFRSADWGLELELELELILRLSSTVH
jgi:hypothetical protein